MWQSCVIFMHNLRASGIVAGFTCYLSVAQETRWSPTYTVFSWAQHHTVGLNDSYKLNTGPLRRLAAGRSGGSNPVGGKFFGTRPDQPWGPPNRLYNGYRLSFPGVKRPGRGVNHPPSSSAEVKGRVELYLCSPPTPVPLWQVIG